MCILTPRNLNPFQTCLKQRKPRLDIIVCTLLGQVTEREYLFNHDFLESFTIVFLLALISHGPSIHIWIKIEITIYMCKIPLRSGCIPWIFLEPSIFMEQMKSGFLH